VSDLHTYACTRGECDGTAHRTQFLLPTGEPNTMKPGVLWECITCGGLWNPDGTPYTARTTKNGDAT